MKGISCTVTITVVLIGCLAAVGHCRLEAMRSYRDGGANTSADTTTMDSPPDGTKVSLKLCAPRDCKTKGEAWNFDDCICCLVMPGVPCWHTMKECQANCRACNPSCASQPAKELHV